MLAGGTLLRALGPDEFVVARRARARRPRGARARRDRGPGAAARLAAVAAQVAAGTGAVSAGRRGGLPRCWSRCSPSPALAANAARGLRRSGAGAARLARRPVVLLGEVHDNAAQHARPRRGAAPAAGRRRAAGDRLRAVRPRAAGRHRPRPPREPPPDGRTAAEHVIEQARAGARLELGAVPAVRRAGAGVRPADRRRQPVARRRDAGGARAASPRCSTTRRARASRSTRCRPRCSLRTSGRSTTATASACRPSLLPALARAQIARDLALAQSIRPHLGARRGAADRQRPRAATTSACRSSSTSTSGRRRSRWACSSSVRHPRCDWARSLRCRLQPPRRSRAKTPARRSPTAAPVTPRKPATEAEPVKAAPSASAHAWRRTLRALEARLADLRR
ncbi:MAG: hypothetical protein MZW92_18795 [Comamonadaceae bacterium]|nr:hypothetical protein [Comamonadaceae bacterium]